MDFRPRLADVRGVAVVLEPEVFDLGITKCLEDASVEFVAGCVRRTVVNRSAVSSKSKAGRLTMGKSGPEQIATYYPFSQRTSWLDHT